MYNPSMGLLDKLERSNWKIRTRNASTTVGFRSKRRPEDPGTKSRKNGPRPQ